MKTGTKNECAGLKKCKPKLKHRPQCTNTDLNVLNGEAAAN